MAWDYANDTVTVRYDARQTSPQRLARAIASQGYEARETRAEPATKASLDRRLTIAPVPGDAPAFFRTAFERAKADHKPLVIDFWAEWCPACVRLKKATLGDPTVAPLWKRVELVYVDLDKYPALGDAYGVTAIPDLFFVDRNGRIVDRLRAFEAPEQFRERLHSLIDEDSNNPAP